MLLNFAAGPTAGPVAQKFRGGSWKDRVRAKKAARFNATRRDGQQSRPTDGTPRTGPNAEDFPDERPPKRRRNDDSDPQHVTTTASTKSTEKKPQSTIRINPDGFVSSLFTSNPVSKSAEAELEIAATPAQPSNAPLVDGLDTFTSLGLSPAIAAHLLTKMELKNPTAIQKAAVAQMLKEDSDAFIQSETGSGKTLAYLLPIVQKIMTMKPEESETGIHRDSGLFAIILAPTRELCKQISVVLERLLGCAHHIVAGTVTGGERKKSEKARLRKGLNILVATPGRLVDHLDNTEVLDVKWVRWLVLDEGDRLMDLGFEQDISKIITSLDQKRRKGSQMGLPEKRTTVLCSATLKMNVQKLGEITLKDAALIKSDEATTTTASEGSASTAFLAPAQLKQSYIVVPSKQRLVTLTALCRRAFARKGSVNKAIVFISCADSVDFHFSVLTRNATVPNTPPEDLPNEVRHSPDLTTTSPVTMYKLHGSLPQPTRTAIVRKFHAATTPSLLIATDVASRGLDLPNLDLVIEYDPAFSSDDHLHRIGRTARVGRDGRAIIFLLPGSEEGYVSVLRSSFKPDPDNPASSAVTSQSAEEVLRKGFSPHVDSSGKEWETKATDWQLAVERWAMADKERLEAAKSAFQSHVRAYATHIAKERVWFDIKELHLGHTAKSFGLREAPGGMNVKGMRGKNSSGVQANVGKRRQPVGGAVEAGKAEVEDTGDQDEAARKMRDVVRKQRNVMLGAGGADEFNLA
jgi:ATP-dependent RNA helicase DDX31/DBP7